MKNALLRRSILYVPVTKKEYVSKAYERGADAIALDLEDSIPISKKKQAREVLRDSIRAAGKAGADVLVRINNNPDLIADDINAAVLPGLSGLIIPKVKDRKELRSIDGVISRAEIENGLNLNKIDISIIIESGKSLFSAFEILRSSKRIVSCWLGTEDFYSDMGIEPSEGGKELLYFKQQLLLAGNVAGVQVMGLIGSITNFGDLELFELNARKAANLGFMGSTCIHPAQVPILNKCFTPSVEKVAWAEKVMSAFAYAESKEEGVASLDGKMIDLPVMQRAKSLLLRRDAIAAKR